MDKRIGKMLFLDCSAVLALILVLWIIIAYVASSVAALAPSASIRVLVLVLALAVALFSSLTAAAVLIHLRKNREKLYREELACREESRAQH